MVKVIVYVCPVHGGQYGNKGDKCPEVVDYYHKCSNCGHEEKSTRPQHTCLRCGARVTSDLVLCGLPLQEEVAQ